MDTESKLKPYFTLCCVLCKSVVNESLTLMTSLDHLVTCAKFAKRNRALKIQLVKMKMGFAVEENHDEWEDEDVAHTRAKVVERNGKLRAKVRNRFYQYLIELKRDVMKDIGATSYKYAWKDRVMEEVMEPLFAELTAMYERSNERDLVLQAFDLTHPEYSFISDMGALVCQGGHWVGCVVDDLPHVIFPAFFDEDFKLSEFFHFDHMVERSKIKDFLVADARRVYESGKDLEFNLAYIFELLFHKNNIKVVHRVD